MANGFSITISAVDRASGILALVNKNMAAIQAPVKRLHDQVNKFAELSGLRKVSQGFDGIVRSSLGAARSVTRVAEPLAAITGAASIGGFVALISKWAEFNSQLGFSASRMGVTAEYLGQLRAQANLAGTSGENAQSGFENLGQTLYDVANGQAPQAAYYFSRMGIALTDATGRARRASEVLPGLVAAIRAVRDPMAQARLATVFFGSAAAGMLPVIRMTNKELEENRQRVLRYGGSTNQGAAAALVFSRAQADVSQSVIGLTDAIETQLAPVLSPLLVDLADWISQARTSKFVTHDLGQGVRDFGAWLRAIDFHKILSDVETFGEKVERVLGSLESWRRTLDSIAGFLGFGSAPPVPGGSAPVNPTGAAGNLPPAQQRAYNLAHEAGAGNPRSPDQQARAAHAMALFQSMGWSRAQAAGMAANIMRESGFFPEASGDNGLAYGIGQWHPDRQANFAKWAGFDIHDPRATLDKQLRFYSFEMTGGKEQEAGRCLRMARNAYESGMVDSYYHLRPAGQIEEADARGKLAKTIYSTVPAGPGVALTAANGDIGAAGSPGATGRVDIAITHDGAAKITARARGNVNPPRIATIMAGAGPTAEMAN